MQNNLILIMKKNHTTIKEIAKLLGISEKQTSLKINGNIEFKCSEMFKIAEYFGTTIDQIFLPSLYDIGT